ncbi:MAG: glycosyltransferase family 39 protein [Snowella sp.]|nr:glycosyltransferase family 39 protein [Snowella sp.]
MLKNIQFKKIINIKNYQDREWFIILTLAAFFLWFIDLGTVALRDWDEGYYATVSQDMFNQNTWLYPTYQGQPFLLKPPLLFWLIHLSYSLLGVSEWTSRLPSAFLAACGVPLLYLISRELLMNRSAAIFSAGVYLTLLPVIRLGRLAMLDGMINTFLLFAILSLLKGKKSPVWLMGIGIGLGLITLTKGILVLALGAILFVFIILDGRWKVLLHPYLWIGFVLGFIPVFLWYGLQIQHYGETFIQVHFQSQSFDRLSTAVEGNTGPIWFYLIDLLKYSCPWFFFFVPGFYLAVRNHQQSWAKLGLIGSILYFGTVSLMTTKLPWYLMPFYIFFALITGAYLDHLYCCPKKYPRLILYLLCLCGIVTLGGVIYFTFFEPKFSLILITLTISITFILTAIQFWKNQANFIPTLIIGIYLTLTFLMISPLWLWELNEAFPVKPVAQFIKQSTPSDTIIYTSFAYSRTSLDFYSDRHILAVDQNKLEELKQKPNYFLLDKENLDKLALTDYQILGKGEGFMLILSNPR